MRELNFQEAFWIGERGRDWTESHNLFELAYASWERDTHVHLKDLLQEFLGDLDRDISILEFGCNSGWFLKSIQDMGFHHLNGIDINELAIRNAKANLPKAHFFRSSIQDFNNPNTVDLVLTGSVLMHIHPDDLKKVMTIIYNSSRKYIFGREISSEEPLHCPTKKQTFWKDKYWTRRWIKEWQKNFPDLKVVKSKFFPFRSNDKVENEVYLLSK